MAIREPKKNRGFTLVELMVTTVAALIVILGAVLIIANAHQGYRRLFNRVNSEVVRNGYEVRRVFDVIVRKATVEHDHIGPGELYVYYYDASLSGGGVDTDALRALIQPNKFAHFYLASAGADLQLRLDRGLVPSTADLSAPAPPGGLVPEPPIGRILAHNVASCIFEERGAGIRMILTLDDETTPAPGDMKIETLKMTITSTAIRHSKRRQY